LTKYIPQVKTAKQYFNHARACDSKMAATPFIAFQGPTNLEGYARKRRPSEQPASIPKTFLDAMEVREQVFVLEQGVPLENEYDSDDARACHWVCRHAPFS